MRSSRSVIVKPWLRHRCDGKRGYATTPEVRKSGCRVRQDYAVALHEDIARVMNVKWQLGLEGGLVIANPVPAAHEVPRDRIERAIEQALQEAREHNIAGKAVTPFLLARIEDLTGRDSLDANVELAVAMRAWLPVWRRRMLHRRAQVDERLIRLAIEPGPLVLRPRIRSPEARDDDARLRRRATTL